MNEQEEQVIRNALAPFEKLPAEEYATLMGAMVTAWLASDEPMAEFCRKFLAKWTFGDQAREIARNDISGLRRLVEQAMLEAPCEPEVPGGWAPDVTVDGGGQLLQPPFSADISVKVGYTNRRYVIKIEPVNEEVDSA